MDILRLDLQLRGILILEALGCADGKDGHLFGGIDACTAEQRHPIQMRHYAPEVVRERKLHIVVG